MNLYDTLRERVRSAAEELALPLGWEGEAFVPPHAPHLRAQIVFTDCRQATLGAHGLTRTDGRVEIRVVTGAGEDSRASALADRVALLFPRGTDISFDDGTATLATPRKGAPAGDGTRTEAVVNLTFYAFQG